MRYSSIPATLPNHVVIPFGRVSGVDLETPPRLLYDVTEAAHQLSVSTKTLERLVADGEVESIKIGRRRLYPRDCLVEFVARRRRVG